MTASGSSSWRVGGTMARPPWTEESLGGAPVSAVSSCISLAATCGLCGSQSWADSSHEPQFSYA